MGQRLFFGGRRPLLGDTITGDQCSVWFQAVILGDVNSIRIGNKVNIQDWAIINGTNERAGRTIGHRAMVHGCTIHDNVLVGMGPIIMVHAVVEENVLIAAGKVVLENTPCESGYLYAGVPAKKVKALSA